MPWSSLVITLYGGDRRVVVDPKILRSITLTSYIPPFKQSPALTSLAGIVLIVVLLLLVVI